MPGVAVTTDLGGGVHEIDTMMSGYAGITAGYLVLGERPCLVETGTARSAPVVRDVLGSLGLGPADQAHLVVIVLGRVRAPGASRCGHHRSSRRASGTCRST